MLQDEKLGHEYGVDTYKRYKKKSVDEMLNSLSADIAIMLCDRLKDSVELDRNYLREMLFRTYHALELIREKVNAETSIN